MVGLKEVIYSLVPVGVKLDCIWHPFPRGNEVPAQNTSL